MKKFIVYLYLAALSFATVAHPRPAVTISGDPLSSIKADHPRLLVSSLKQFDEIARQMQTGDAFLVKARSVLEKRASKMLREPVEQYTLKPSKYLLNVSRNVLEKSYTLSMMYRITGDRRYADRLWTELKNASEFPDWDPAHFLGTAEMTHAFAISYDWMYDVWSPEQRSVLKQAITDKGLKAGKLYYDHQIKGVDWPNVTHNWNLVCNGAMMIGALAIADETNKPFCTQIVNNVLASVPKGMSSFAPDGAWAEGPNYQAYALKYNVAMLASMQTALGTDAGLSDAAGFSGAGKFVIAMSAPDGNTFNYADGAVRVIRAPELLWLARRFDQPELAKYQIRYSNHTLASELIWYLAVEKRAADKAMSPNNYFGKAEVASLRTSWNNKNGWFVAFKGGDNGANHAHLDIGNFVLDRNGERWAVDLGSDSYNLPGYFGKQTRWDYYRTGTEGHNTLVFTDAAQNNNQLPKGTGRIIRFKAAVPNPFGIIDLTNAYAGATSVKRGIALLDNKGVVVRDEIDARALDRYWQIQTPASIQLSADKRTATLSLNGKQLVMQILSPSKQQVFEVISAEPLRTRSLVQAKLSFGSHNEGVSRLAIHINGEARSQIVVLFRDPGPDNIDIGAFASDLSNWN